MSEPVLIKYLDQANQEIYSDFLLPNIQYAEVSSGEKLELIKKSCKELADKLVKIKETKNCFLEKLEIAKSTLDEEISKGVVGITAHGVESGVENFLTQAKGLLDIFTSDFLRETINYDDGEKNNWSGIKIKKFIKTSKNFDKEIAKEIETYIDDSYKKWLKDLINDRNLHHEKNLKLSNIVIDNKVSFQRANGQTVNDIVKYLDGNYQNLYSFVKTLTYKVFCLICPSIAVSELNGDYFMGNL